MSEPTRYRVANNQAQLTLGGGILVVEPAGPLVEYTDYARLHSLFANSEQENASLNNYIERLEVRNAELVSENARLKAKVERLRKAGDNLERVLTARSGSYEAGNASHEWNAAKEGKQS